MYLGSSECQPKAQKLFEKSNALTNAIFDAFLAKYPCENVPPVLRGPRLIRCIAFQKSSNASPRRVAAAVMKRFHRRKLLRVVCGFGCEEAGGVGLLSSI